AGVQEDAVFFVKTVFRSRKTDTNHSVRSGRDRGGAFGDRGRPGTGQTGYGRWNDGMVHEVIRFGGFEFQFDPVHVKSVEDHREKSSLGGKRFGKPGAFSFSLP